MSRVSLPRKSSFTPASSSGEENVHDDKTIRSISQILNRKQSSAAALMNKAASQLNCAYDLRSTSAPEELIFQLLRPSPEVEKASVDKLIKVLETFGITENDPRLAITRKRMRGFEEQSEDFDARNFYLNKSDFKFCIQPSVPLISQSLRSQLVIPDFILFSSQLEQIFETCRTIRDGNVATYIPQLARQDPDLWGMSICTIDGQRCSFGDSSKEFCIQSVSKAFNYAIVASELGTDVVHSYVGYEPSGRLFNDICLDSNGKPHNPMINAGAIITASLMKKGLDMADRFDFVLQKYRELAGQEHVGFDNATFLSERDSADRNYALSYYMKEMKCFPEGTASIEKELDFYFQLCSMEANCETLSVMAATLANGGMCPLTRLRCLASQPCRDVLSLMYSCGMYDLSGKFAFQKLVDTFSFHNYDSMINADSKKIDPRVAQGKRDTDRLVAVLFAAKNGDLQGVQRLHAESANLECADYDGRTALHIAASEGQIQVMKFLLKTAKVNFQPKDRWGRTPLEDALMFNHLNCVELLMKHEQSILGKSNRLVEESENSDDVSESETSESDSDDDGMHIMHPQAPRSKTSSSARREASVSGLILQLYDDVNHFESVTPCCSHSLTASNTEDSNGEGAAGVVQPPEVATRAPFRSLNRSSSSSFLSPSSDCFNPGTLSAAKSLYITISMTSVSEEKGHPIKKPTCHDH